MTTEKKLAYPSILQVFGLLGLYLGLAVMFAFFLAPVLPMDKELQGLITLLAYVVPMVILALFAVRNTSWHWREVFGSPLRFGTVNYILLAALVIANLFVIDPILSFFPMPEWIKEMLEGMINPNIGSFITVVFGAALLEEYLFRGIVLRGFLANYSPKKAIIWSALLFGLFHFNPWQFFAASIIGLYMGWIYYRTGSLWPCIFLHFFNNLLAFSSYIFISEEAVIYDFTQNLGLAAASITGGGVAVYMIVKVLDARLPKIDHQQKSEAYDAPST